MMIWFLYSLLMIISIGIYFGGLSVKTKKPTATQCSKYGKRVQNSKRKYFLRVKSFFFIPHSPSEIIPPNYPFFWILKHCKPEREREER